MKRWVAIAAGILLFPLSSSADVVFLKDGKQIEGEIVKREAGKVVVKSKFGTTELKEADIDRIEQKLAPKDEFAKRRAAVDAKDTAALMELYAWAKGEGLKTESTAVLRDIIKVEPDHDNARKLLGYVQVDGKWLTEKDAAKAKAKADAAEMEAKGLVQFKGEWITPEEKDKREHEAKGELLVDGKWVNKRDYERAAKEAAARKEADEHRAQGEYLVNDKWVPKSQAEAAFKSLESPYIVRGDHVTILTTRGIDFGDRIITTAEAAYRKAHQFFGKEPTSRLNVFVVDSQEDYKALGGQILNGDEKSSNFYAFCSAWLPENPAELDMASATFYNQADSLTDIYVIHATVEQFVHRLLGPDAADLPPRWFVDGVACYMDRWLDPALSNWCKDALRREGGAQKLKTFLGSYTPTEQTVFEAGLLVHFLKSTTCPAELQEAFNEAVVSLNDGKKVSKAFRKLEKALLAAEDAFLDYADL